MESKIHGSQFSYRSVVNLATEVVTQTPKTPLTVVNLATVPTDLGVVTVVNLTTQIGYQGDPVVNKQDKRLSTRPFVSSTRRFA